MKFSLYLFIILFPATSFAQAIDTSVYEISVDISKQFDHFFTHDTTWRGADGAASVDMGNGKVLWLFSDSFISLDSPFSRKKSVFVRNSVATQQGYDIKTASLKFYWNRSGKKPKGLFSLPGKTWFWTGHGTRIKDKLVIFLIKERGTKKGLGFEAIGWSAVLISNPDDEPSAWNMKYIEGPETFGTIAGSAAVLTDENYLYAYGAVEPSTHEVYILRWKLSDAYAGNFAQTEWWINGTWTERKTKLPIPAPLFIGGTEYSVHYDSLLKKFIQVQSFGFGEGKIGIRMADKIMGPWTEPYFIYTPDYPGVKQPFMYSVKAHPELVADGIYITYNVNSFDFGELIENQTIYFPKFILLKIVKR
jgi:hypothetical protein